MIPADVAEVWAAARRGEADRAVRRRPVAEDAAEVVRRMLTVPISGRTEANVFTDGANRGMQEPEYQQLLIAIQEVALE